MWFSDVSISTAEEESLIIISLLFFFFLFQIIVYKLHRIYNLSFKR